ncbi:MAG: hypothetical protein SCH70_06600 [Candidatus Methanoperedens sp.]|nr:hypothetical protein [Candidatus Methanoperedens sp.]
MTIMVLRDDADSMNIHEAKYYTVKDESIILIPVIIHGNLRNPKRDMEPNIEPGAPWNL